MKRFALATLLLLVSNILMAGDAIQVSGAYVRAVPPGIPNSIAYMLIHNGDAVAHALVSAASPAAKVVELHTHIQEDGMMKMRQVEKIELPAGETAKLQPGGLHVMLIGLVDNLKDGDTVELTLEFDDGGKRHMSLPVKKIGFR